MKKNLDLVAGVVSNNAAAVVNEESAKKTSSRVKVKPTLTEDTAISLDEEENENPRKKEVFDNVKKLFGFEVFDENTFAENLLKNGCTYSELKTSITKERKRINKVNENLETLTFDMVCEKISKSSLLSDLSLFVGTSELSELREKLVNDKKQVILYHGAQSDNNEKFESFKVSVKGLHKPFEDTCYYSLVEYSVTNLLRALRNYSYYLASIKRCKRMKNNETDNVGTLKSVATQLHDKFGYSKEDLVNVINSLNF
jgi:hypothetical protein